MRALIFLLLLSSTAIVRADVEGTTFRQAKWGVQLVMPRGWVLTDQSTPGQANYPGVLLVATRGAATISLAVQALSEADTLKTYAQRNVDALAKIGVFTKITPLVPKGAMLQVEAQTATKTLRQEYLTHGLNAYVVTIAVPATSSVADMSDFYSEFDVVIRGLSFQ